MSCLYKIVIDKNKCIGCGNCAALCHNFEMTEDGKAKVKIEEVEDLGCNQIAAESCPTGAITIKKVSQKK